MQRINRFISRLAFGVAMGTCAVASPPAQAGVTQDWAVIRQGSSASMLAVDQDNNAYVAGYLPGSSILLTKFGPTGVQLWERVFDNPPTAEASNWVTLDPSGNPIVVGLTYATANGVGTGFVVLKYDAAGNLLWQDVIPGAFAGAVRAATDAAGNVYVLGTGAAGIGRDLTTIKYTPSGTRAWTRSYLATPSALHGPAAMVVTSAGNVIVTGGSQATMDAVAYDPVGNQIWAKAISPATAANDVVLGLNGEFYLVGGDLTPGAPKGMLVVKFDANFNELWRKTYSVGGKAVRAGVDSAGNLVATGPTAAAYFNWVTIKVDASGALLWSRLTDRMPSPDEVPNALVIGSDNAIYVTGEAGWLSTDNGTITTYLGATTEKYGPDGTLLWTTQAQIPMRGRGIKLGNDGGVFVVGDGPRALLHYSQADGGTGALAALAFASTSVNAGGVTTGTLTFSAPAPVDTVVLLRSSNASASVPASVVVLQGATSANFVLSGFALVRDARSLNAVITATQGGISRSATVTVLQRP